VGAPYVCSAPLGDAAALGDCVRGALAADLPPFTPPDFEPAAYAGRVRRIFKDCL
jgi:hypothetical protein